MDVSGKRGGCRGKDSNYRFLMRLVVSLGFIEKWFLYVFFHMLILKSHICPEQNPWKAVKGGFQLGITCRLYTSSCELGPSSFRTGKIEIISTLWRVFRGSDEESSRPCRGSVM